MARARADDDALHARAQRDLSTGCTRRTPSWTDDQLFDKARLINAALIAKIHTIEWTPAILGHPTLQVGMRANWFGLAGERVHDLSAGSGDSDLLSGIPGSATDHHAAPYAITEDFVTVYRMHPLIPDDYVIRDLERRRSRSATSSWSSTALHSRELLERVRPRTRCTRWACANPGAVTLHNSPAVHAPADAHRRHPHRPRRRRHPALPRARRAPLQRVPPTAPHAPGHAVRPDLRRRPGDRETAARGLRRRPREGRLHGRDVRRAAPAGLRVQRHGVPDLRPHGVTTAQERPVLHRRLHAADVHARGHGTGSTRTTCCPCSSGTTPSSRRCCATSRTPSRPGPC